MSFATKQLVKTWGTSADSPGTNGRNVNRTGPFYKSGSDVVYLPTFDSDNTNSLTIFKATDPIGGGTWSNAGSRTAFGLPGSMTATWERSGYLAMVHEGSFVYVDVFNTATDTWDGSQEQCRGNVTTEWESVEIRYAGGTNEVLLAFYQSSFETIHGKDWQRISYSRRSGGTWTHGTAITPTGTQKHYMHACAIPAITDSEDTHVIWLEGTDGANPSVNSDIGGRTLRADNTLSTYVTDTAPASSPAAYGNVWMTAVYDGGTRFLGHAAGNGNSLNQFDIREDGSGDLDLTTGTHVNTSNAYASGGLIGNPDLTAYLHSAALAEYTGVGTNGYAYGTFRCPGNSSSIDFYLEEDEPLGIVGTTPTASDIDTDIDTTEFISANAYEKDDGSVVIGLYYVYDDTGNTRRGYYNEYELLAASGGNTHTATTSGVGTPALLKEVRLSRSFSGVGTQTVTKGVAQSFATSGVGSQALTKVATLPRSTSGVGTPDTTGKLPRKRFSTSGVGTSGTPIKETKKNLSHSGTGTSALTKEGKLFFETSGVGTPVLTTTLIAFITALTSGTGTPELSLRIKKALATSGLGTPDLLKNVQWTRSTSGVGTSALTRNVKLSFDTSGVGTPALSAQQVLTQLLNTTGIGTVALNKKVIREILTSGTGTPTHVKTFLKSLDTSGVGTPTLTKVGTFNINTTGVGTPVMNFIVQLNGLDTTGTGTLALSTTVIPGGGTTYFHTATTSGVGTSDLSVIVNKALDTTGVGSPTLTKLVQYLISTTGVGTPALTLLLNKFLATTGVGTADLTNIVLQSFNTSATGTPELAKIVAKQAQTAGLGTPTLAKKIEKQLATAGIGGAALTKLVKFELLTTALGTPSLTTLTIPAGTVTPISLSTVGIGTPSLVLRVIDGGLVIRGRRLRGRVRD